MLTVNYSRTELFYTTNIMEGTYNPENALARVQRVHEPVDL